MNISIYVAEELYSLGFSFKRYSNNVHKGMVFHYNNEDWIIGGRCETELSNDDINIIVHGTWLPSDSHLLEWLADNDFVYAIVNNDGFYDVTCKDVHTNTTYHTKMPTLEFSLASIIKKILKKNERLFDRNEKPIGIVIHQSSNTGDGPMCPIEE